MNRDTAIKVQESGCAATSILSEMLEQIAPECSDEEYAAIKRAVGLAIGRIQMELLEPLYVQHPDLDDLLRP